jgi:hypothetical protein
MERWLPVVGQEGKYEISDHGHARSVDRTVTQRDRWGNLTTRRLKGRLLKPARTKMANGDPGYSFIKLPGNVTLLLHLAVLEAFVGPRPGYWADGCHKDDDRDNNRLENLEWATHAKNQQAAVKNGRNQNSNKTHCKNGHEFTPENTIHRTSSNGRPGRDCRRCQADSTRRHREKSSARQPADVGCQP